MIRLKELRNTTCNPKGRKISQQEIADIIGTKRSTVSMWELGASDPDTETLTKIADYFGVTTDYLLGREESTSASQDEENKKPADLKKILENQQVMFDGEVVTEEDKELINKMLEKMYWTAKEKNKRKK